MALEESGSVWPLWVMHAVISQVAWKEPPPLFENQVLLLAADYWQISENLLFQFCVMPLMSSEDFPFRLGKDGAYQDRLLLIGWGFGKPRVWLLFLTNVWFLDWGDLHKYLITPHTTSTTDQGNNSTQVYLCEPESLLSLLTGKWVTQGQLPYIYCLYLFLLLTYLKFIFKIVLGSPNGDFHTPILPILLEFTPAKPISQLSTKWEA